MQSPHSKLGLGFVYTVEAFDAAGNHLGTDTVHNLVPDEGVNAFLDILFNAATQQSWFIGIYGNNYAPLASNTASNFPALAGELTVYESATRPAFDPGAAAGGIVTNALAKAEFVMTSDATVRGGFISSSSVKGGTTGILASAVLFPMPRQPGVGGALRVTAGFQIIPTPDA